MAAYITGETIRRLRRGFVKHDAVVGAFVEVGGRACPTILCGVLSFGMCCMFSHLSI